MFVYCVIAYALIVILLLGFWCTPIEGYWALPVKNCTCRELAGMEEAVLTVAAECATYFNHLKHATAHNVLSDLLLLCIPIPIVVRSKVPMRR